MDPVLTKNTCSADLSAPFGLKHEAQCSKAGAEMSDRYTDRLFQIIWCWDGYKAQV
jgi:hypothetical protein